ncbi:ATPase, T2SS/T4P/T4SS family [Orbus sturtevantii]|uniref:ATPase, T2SS/T4P/T4SS family n=1 Tax=Orbus sturtevantii TaxID=3074109 RepID=UPI00370D66EC
MTNYSDLEIIELVNKLLNDALLQRASDIHFEPYQEEYRIRMRIDGVLQLMSVLPILLVKPLTVRLKIMAKLNIAEQRLPQDGQLLNDKQAMRISTIPTLYGEKIVLRIMEQQQNIFLLEQLGLSEYEQYHYRQALNNPQGLILVTGPTGSGKTITLYSGLKEINNNSRNICSVEDPVEMPVIGINQTQVNPKAGLDFAKTLRAFLRQDPDVIMIGEIRDQETAEIAIQASQTGHLVLSTLHTNSSAEALIRLNQMGIKRYLIAASLKLIIAQRLARKLCHHCKILADEKFIVEENNAPTFYAHYLAKGCQHCIGGYYGRIGLYELFIITPQIQTLLASNDNFSLHNIQQIMKKHKIKTLYLSGVGLVKQGLTSLAEIQRVLGSINE